MKQPALLRQQSALEGPPSPLCWACCLRHTGDTQLPSCQLWPVIGISHDDASFLVFGCLPASLNLPVPCISAEVPHLMDVSHSFLPSRRRLLVSWQLSQLQPTCAPVEGSQSLSSPRRVNTSWRQPCELPPPGVLLGDLPHSGPNPGIGGAPLSFFPPWGFSLSTRAFFNVLSNSYYYLISYK